MDTLKTQGTSTLPLERKIIKIKASAIHETAKLHVAEYACVSSDSAD